MYLISYRLFAENILDTYIESKNLKNIFWLVFVGKVLDYFKLYQSWLSPYSLYGLGDSMGADHGLIVVYMKGSIVFMDEILEHFPVTSCRIHS